MFEVSKSIGSVMINPSQSILLTDLYMLTMLEGFYKQEMDGVASYEFFVRNLPRTAAFWSLPD